MMTRLVYIKRILLIFTVALLCIIFNSTLADRYVNSADCNSVNDFINAIEMGTTVTAEGYVYSSPFDYTMDNVDGYRLGIILDIKGCIEQNIFLMTSKDQADGLEKGDYVSVSGKMFSRGNTGSNYYFNTQVDGGYVEKKEKPIPSIFDLNEEKYNLVSRVKEHRIGDIAKGKGLEIVLTDEYTYSSSTTYYFVLASGNLQIQFYTHSKDLFKGDIIDFEGTIYNYDEKSKTLLCKDPIYQLHNNQ